MSKASSRASALVGALLTAALTAGCGYTQQQWQAQMDKYERVVSKQRVADEKLDALNGDLVITKDKLKLLQDKVKALGVDLEGKDTILAAGETLKERELAVQEYRLKVKQLEAIASRFELLRVRLDDLVKLGVEVRIRKNRLLVSLPGDVLFEPGKDALKKEGRDLLAKVAIAIGGDTALANRDYQVAGHTDSTPPKGGAVQDNWALSVLRARQILVFLIDEKGGKLSAKRFSAAGFADSEPIASNDTEEGKQANRRCELVLLPSMEETLDLRAIGASPSRNK